jgi:hypothetical protein
MNPHEPVSAEPRGWPVLSLQLRASHWRLADPLQRSVHHDSARARVGWARGDTGSLFVFTIAVVITVPDRRTADRIGVALRWARWHRSDSAAALAGRPDPSWSSTHCGSRWARWRWLDAGVVDADGQCPFVHNRGPRCIGAKARRHGIFPPSIATCRSVPSLRWAVCIAGCRDRAADRPGGFATRPIRAVRGDPRRRRRNEVREAGDYRF